MSQNETINEKITRLNNDVEWFYGEDFSLDTAIEKYKKAIELSNEIESDLNNLKNQVEVISQDFSQN